MIKFNKEEISLLKELVPYLGIDNEEKEHRKYSSFYYRTFYTFKESDIEWFEDDYIHLFHKVVGLTIVINGMWDDSNGLDELSIDIKRSVGSKNPDYDTLLDIINNSKESFSDEVFNKIITNLNLIIPENVYMTTEIPFEVVK
ncbi:hypothetical protein [Proteus phage J3S]